MQAVTSAGRHWVAKSAAFLAAVLFAAGMLLTFNSNESSATLTARADAAVYPETQASELLTIPIQEIEPAAFRVLADNPETPGQAPGDFGEFDPDSWSVHRFEMAKPNGGLLQIGLARPGEWLSQQSRNDNGDVWLEFEELGIAGFAQLLDTETCPTSIQGEGRLVTGTFAHSSAEILRITIEGEPEPIGCTGNHPFWSEDRQKFVRAEDLELDERLLDVRGAISAVVAIDHQTRLEAVYNLEVDGEHVYNVGISGFLVHNAGRPYGSQLPSTPGGRRLTNHSAYDSLERHGFRPPFGEVDDIIAQAQWQVTQGDGATVHIHRIAGRKRKYRMVVESENGIVTAFRTLTPYELAGLSRNYEFPLPW